MNKRRASLPRTCKRVHTNPVVDGLELLDLPSEILVMILQLASTRAEVASSRLWTYRSAIGIAGTCRRFQDLFVNYVCAAMSLPPAQMAEDFFMCNGVCESFGYPWSPTPRYRTTRAEICQTALWELRFIRTLRAANQNVAFLPPRTKMERLENAYYSASIIFRDPKRPALAFVWPTEMANAYAQEHYSDRKPPIELEPRMSIQFMENCRARHQASN